MKDCAIGVIFRNQDRKEILLVQRQDVPVWVLPGGGIDDGETAEQAAIREVYEETGFIVQISRQVAEYYPINSLATLTSTFECTIVTGIPTPSDESRAVEFFPLDQLPKMLFPLHKEWLRDALTSSEVLRKPIAQVTIFSLMKLFLQHPILCARFLINKQKVKPQMNTDKHR